MRIHIIIIVVFFIHCANLNQKNISSLEESNSNSCLAKHGLSDLKTSHRNIISYKEQSGKIIIKWGKGNSRRIFKDSFDCDLYSNSIPRYLWDNNDFIAMRYTCGSPCWGTYILPVKKGATEFISFDLAFNAQNNLVVYPDFDQLSYSQLVVENIKSKRKQFLNLGGVCKSAFIGNCIDSIKFNEQTLFLRWTLSPSSKNPEYYEKTFSLNH